MIAFISNNLKMGLCPDSARYYRVLGPYKDFHPLPCEEKKGKKSQFQFAVYPNSLPPIRIE